MILRVAGKLPEGKSTSDFHHIDIGFRIRLPSKDLEVTSGAGRNEQIQLIAFKNLRPIVGLYATNIPFKPKSFS